MSITPADAIPLRRNPTVIAAYITGVLSLVGSCITVGGSFVGDGAPASGSNHARSGSTCLPIVIDFREQIRKDPRLADILVEQSPEGKSVVAADETAARCAISEGAIRKMAEPG
jgi:hypothetical protein